MDATLNKLVCSPQAQLLTTTTTISTPLATTTTLRVESFPHIPHIPQQSVLPFPTQQQQQNLPVAPSVPLQQMPQSIVPSFSPTIIRQSLNVNTCGVSIKQMKILNICIDLEFVS
jgi:hypothetical protein